MNLSERKRNSTKPSILFWLLVSAAVAAGTLFRLTHLDSKFYWIDESYTLLRVSGHSISEVKKQFYDGHVFQAKDLQQLQQISAGRDWTYSLSALAPDFDQTPIYYLLARFWAEHFGTEIGYTRLLPALLSLFVFPAMYWLCLELSGSTRAAAWGVALVALSPFHVLMAQEARPYSLWTATTLAFCASLIMAIRLRKTGYWVGCSAMLTVSLYTQLLTIYVGLSQLLYVLISARAAGRRIIVAYLIALAAALFFFAPWLFLIYLNWTNMINQFSWVERKVPAPEFFKAWVHQFGLLFCDLNIPAGSPADVMISLLALLLILWAINFLWRKRDKREFWFVACLMGSTSIPLLVQDLLFGGFRSLVLRYLLPCYIAIQVAVAFLLDQQTLGEDTIKRTIWWGVAVFVLSIGAASCLVSSQSWFWWNKFDGPEAASVARQVNHTQALSKSTLLICGGDAVNSLGRLLSLARLLDPDAKIAVVKAAKSWRAPEGFEYLILWQIPRAEFEQLRKPEAFSFSQDKDLGDRLFIGKKRD